jgi:hypothetical protein
MGHNLDEIFYMMLNIIEVILNMLDHRNVVNMLMSHELINDNHEFYVDNYRHDQVQMFVLLKIIKQDHVRFDNTGNEQ